MLFDYKKTLKKLGKTKVIRLISFLSFIFILESSNAQKIDSVESKRVIIFSPGITIQKHIYADLNIVYADRKSLTAGPCSSPIVAGGRLGLEYNLDNSNPIIAPKIGFEVSGLMLCLRTSAIYYINKNQNDFRILPELGFSFAGLASLTYGYGISLQKAKLNEVSNSRLSLTINLHKIILDQFK